MTTGTPCVVRMRSLICALTSVSPATCSATCCIRLCAQRTRSSTAQSARLGVVDEALPRLDVGWQVSRAALLEALDDGLRCTALRQSLC